MAKFEITAPDGKKYRVSGENAEGAHASLMKHLSLGNSPTGVPEGEGFGEVDMGVPSPQDALTAAMGGQPGIPLPPASEEDSGFLPAVVPPVATVPTATRLDPGAQPIDGAPIIDPLMEAMTTGTPAASTFTRPRPNPRLGAGPAAPAVPEAAAPGMDPATEPRVVAITKKLADPNITPETRAVLEGRLRAILGDRPEEGAMPVPVSDTLQPIVPPDYQPAPDEFEGEGALSLLRRRGQQFVKGAANIFAGVPEGLAIHAAAADQRDILSAGHMEAQAGRFGQEIAAVEGRMAEIEATLGLNGKTAPKVAREDRTAFAEQRASLEAEYLALGEQRGQLRSALGPGGEEAMRAEAAAELAGGVDPETGKLKPASERDLFKAGDVVREAAADTFGAPDPRDKTFWGKLAEGAGSVGAFASTALVPGGAVVKTVTGGALGAESNAASLYTEALEAGADEETAQKAAAWGSVIGAGEIIPINRALKILPRSWGPAVSNQVMKGFAEIAESAGEEAAQEYLATVANNIVASGYYDPERGWDEGAGEAAIIGAILGGGLGVVGAVRGDPESARAPVVAPREGGEDETPPPLVGNLPTPSAPTAPPDSANLPTPEDELAAAMGLPAPVAPVAKPVAPEKPPVAAKAPEKAPEKPPVAPADDAEFAVMDEVETVDGEERATGRKVRVNLNTGDAEVIEDSETGAEVGGDGAGGRGAPEEKQAVEADSPPAEPSPVKDKGQINGNVKAETSPSTPDPEFTGDRPPPVRKFLTHDETLAIKTDPKTFQYKGGSDTEGVTDALRNIKTFDPNRAGQVVLFERKDGTVVVADGHQRTGLARRAAEGGQADVGGAAATVYREVDGYTAEEVMGLAALKNIGEGSGSAVDAARILRTRSESIADLGLPPNSALVRKAEGIRRLGDDAFGMVANGVATEEHADVVGRNVPDKALQADILAMLTRMKPDNLAQAAMIARDAAADSTTETQTDMFGDLQVQKSLYVERAKVLDAAMKSQGILAKTFRNLVEREGVITSAGNQLDTKANAALVDEAGQVRQYLQSQANMKGAISDALTKAANAVRSGTSVARAADGFVQDVKSALQGAGPGSEAPPGGGAPDEGRAENQPDPVTPEPGADLFGAMLGTAPKAEPKPDPGADLFAAMGGTPPQKGKTTDQVRAEAEAKVKAAQSKAGTTVPQKEAGPLFDDQADIEKPAAPVDPISRGRDILKPFTKPGDEIYDPLSGPDLRDTDKGKALSEALGKAKTAAERETIADAYVLKEGKASGLEHLVVLAEDGAVLAIMSGHKSGVSLHAAVWRAIEAGKAAYATHNHPKSSDFSGPDITFLARGLKKIVAMAHNGRRHVATPIPGALPKPAAFHLVNGKEVHSFERDVKLLNDLRIRIGIELNNDTYQLPAYKADPTKAPEEWTRANRIIASLVMARMGLFKYEGATEAEVTADGFNFEDIYGRSSSAFTDRLGRAGFVLAKGRDQSGNGAPEGGAGTAQPAADGADQRTALPDGPGDRAGRLPAPDPVAKADAFDKTASDVLDDIFGAKPAPAQKAPATGKKRSDDDIAKDLGSLFNEDPAKFMSPMERAKAKAKARPTRQQDLFDMLNAARPGERQVDLEDYIDEKKAADRDLFGFGEDVISTAKYAQAVPLFREILAGQDVNAQPVVDTIRAVALRFKDNGLTRDGIERMLPYLKLYLADVRDGKLTNPVEDGDVSGADGNLEPDRGDAAAGDGLGKTGVPASGRGPGGTGDRGRTAPGDGDGQRNPGDGVPDGDAASVGTEGDPALSGGIRAEPGAAVDRDGAGGRDRSEQRPAPDSQPAAHTERYATDTSKPSVADRKAQQAEADRLTKAQGVKWADEANVRQSLPLLKPEQQDDVIKIEKRFAKPDGHGMLLTNGTGTGKTYSGGGQVKRFVQAGKTNILIAAPSQGILDHWENALADMGIETSRLSSTTDSGKGVTLTTYANMGENETLADRDWDLVVTDEAHKLSQNAAGDATSALQTLRAITNRPADRQKASMMRRRAAWAKAAAMPDGDAKTEAYNRLFALARQDADEMATKPRAKVLFLSATPFAYVKNTDYAEGYLFDYPSDGRINGSNQPGRNLFMVENFGMRIRYHKLTQPDVGVDTGVFEREFHEKMKRDGVLSGRMLDIDADYDRVFVASESAEGVKIDQILQFISDQANAKGDDQRVKEYQALKGSLKNTFNYLKQMQLLEAIKADKATKDIEAHLKLGRKVVVFHDYNVGGGFNPFRPVADMEKGIIPTAEAYAGYARLVAEKPEVEKLNFAGLLPPVEALKKRFGDRAVIYNGTVPQKIRKKAKADFQTDGSGIDVIIVQSAAGEAGIDLHDTTGGHQRALINLGMPVRPTTALQEEGRIRREGSITDAAFRYYTIGTAWERRAFAAKIAQRSGTVENLALGNQARTIRDSFIDAFTDASPVQPADGDGKGGKVKDRAQASTSPYDTAKTHYYGRMKTTGKRDQREGLDFYPTPEPLAFKMVEWAGIRAYERALEPSAGDGSIARYLPEHARRTIIEPSMDLLSKAEMRAPGSTGLNRTFEDYHIANKHHAIIMNPPFGSGGKTAMEHLAKAAKHLKPGGRIVALIPEGPSANKRFDDWRNSPEAADLHLTAYVQLPAVTFEKAGTAIQSRVVVLDKVGVGQSRTDWVRANGGEKPYSLHGASTIEQLFDRLEDITLPPRVAQRFDPTEEIDIEVDEDGNPVEQAIETAAPPARIGKPVADSMGGFKLAQTKHGKTGADLFVATAENRVDDDAYKMALAVAKSHGGWYSYFKGSGAIPGFQFKSEAQRQAFLDDMGKPTIGGMEETAYHGSPHQFDRFSLDKIGTGEGAQVYGWGLYFAGRRDVAEYYRNKLTVPKLMIEGDIAPSFFFGDLSSKTIGQVEELLAEKPAAKPAEISAEDWRNAKSLLPITLFRTFNNLRDKVRNTPGEDPKKRLAIYRETALARYQANVADARVHDAMERASELAAIDWLADRASVQGSGSLFKVEVPEKEDLLDWGAPISKHSPQVQEQLVPVIEAIRRYYSGSREKALNGGLDGFIKRLTGREVLEFLQTSGATYGFEPDGFDFAKGVKGSIVMHQVRDTATGEVLGEADMRHKALEKAGIRPDRYAALALKKLGIPGHRFLDQGSRDDGEGTYNYVIYDEAKIQITGLEEDPAVFVSELKDELGLRDLSMFVTRSGDLKLNMIAVPRDQQGQGIGTKAMERIAEYADAGNLRIIASPGQRDDGFGTTSRDRLVRFYKRFGFVENKGRNKDFSISEGLYRPAKTPKLQSPRLPSVQSIIDEVDQKAAGLKVGETPAFTVRTERDPDDEGLMVEAMSKTKKDATGAPLVIGHLHVPDDAIKADRSWSIGDISVSAEERRKGVATSMVKAASAQIGGQPTGATSVFSKDGKAFFDSMQRTRYQAPRLPSVQSIIDEVDQKAAALKVGEIKRALKAELERLDLKRVNLRFQSNVDWQGLFLRETDGSMFVVIGAAHDPMATLHHEVIHVLKEMNLFTEGEWAALEKAAEKWIAKYDIATRYPSLTRAEQLEEAIAEEFGESFAKKQAPRGSLLITAFNKIIRFFKAVRNAAQGLGFRTAEDIFGRALSGEISARQRAWDRAPEPNRHEATVKADAFKKWFGKSMVTDKAGKPLQVYHGTKFDQDINIFLPMTHFGTARAAGQRLNEKEDWSPAYKPDGERLYPVYVSMENPLQIGREQGFGQNGEWVDDSDMIRQIGKTLEREAETATGERKAALTGAAERLAALSEDTYKERVTAVAARTQTAEILDELGYDGLTYTNIIEDSSNVSYVPLHGKQIKSPFNRGTFDPRDPRISYQKARLPSAQARAHMATPMGGQHLHIPDRRIWQELSRAGAPIWERLGNGAAAARDAVDRARVVIQDRMLPLRRAQFEIEKLRGSPLPSSMDPYTVETTFSGKVGRHLFEIDEDYTKPIVSLIARTKGRLTAESVGTWLYARHAIERNARIASINPAMPDGGSGMTDAEAQTILAAAAASPDAAALDQIGKYIDALRERSLTLRQSKGLITATEANRWRTQYKHYVPLKGWADSDQSDMMLDVSGVGRRFNTRGQESRRALGRKSEAFNPLQAAITQAQEVAIRAEKNAVGQAAYELAKAYPSPALWSIKQVKMKQVFNRTTGLVEMRPEDPVSLMMDPNEMAVKVSGIEHRIVFHDPRLARALGQVGADQMNGVMRVLSLMSRFFSMTRTMLNPEFMITNAFRDFQTAQFGIQAFGINPKTKQDDRVAIAAAMAANWRKAFSGVYRGMGNKADTTWSKHFREFQKAGANISFWTLDQPEAAVDDLDRRIDLARGKRAARMLKRLRPSAVFSMRDNPVLAFIERTNLAVDNAIRLAAFIKARELGWDVQDAAFLAKELTVNFNRRGETTSTVNALYPFFNAAIQGSVRVAKALTSRRVAMLALMSVGAGVVLDLVNAMLSDRDDDDELFYDKIPEYRNERNLHLVLWGTGDNPAAIPMPYGYNIFPYAGQQIGKVIRGVKKPDEAFGDVMVAAFGAFSPVNGGTPETTVAPFFADPFVELAQNENFAGNTIYPAFPKTGAPDSQVFYPSATLTSRYVAETLNAMTGGDFRQPGLIDVSPETMDHLAAYVGGSAAAFWGRNTDIVGKVLSGKTEEIEQQDVPFVRILTTPITKWVDLDSYRQFSLDVRDANADAKAYTEAGQKVPPEVRARADLYEDYLAAERELKGQGDWNANKAGALTPRDDQAIWLSFNRKYLKVTRPKP